MGNMKTPGVYILEKNAFPNSVVEVATAVPAFVGYTEKAMNKGNSLTMRPWPISSMAEFVQYFGEGPVGDHVRFSLAELKAAKPPAEGSAAAKKTAAASAPLTADKVVPLAERDEAPLRVGDRAYQIKQTAGFYLLFNAMRLFFQNGGGKCYVVSVGGYAVDRDDKGAVTGPTAGVHVDADELIAGIAELAKEQEPTMVVVPEAVLLKKKDCDKVQQQMLMHCGKVMKNRFAILDVWEGYRPRTDDPDCVLGLRDGVGSEFLDFGAAYYPWINTSIVGERELSFANIANDSRDDLAKCIQAELDGLGLAPARLKEQKDAADKIKTPPTDAGEAAILAKTLTTISPFFNAILGEMARRINLVPPSAAMAGIYTLVDNGRGVWKAPANVGLNSVVSAALPISHEQQEDLNVSVVGKSVNAIRGFIGEGTLVWGARTLDGNSLDWRYINVRRTMIMLEESIRLAAKAMVFEPNTANTWVTMKGMIGNFLTSIWKRGGLAGAVPEDAFSVHVGLGETMTPEDILEGILRVTVLVAISRPAEFIEITFQQQMQKS